MRNKEKLLKKIKTLSERGVGCEKESAEKLLLQLMEKYKITEDEISEDSVEFEWFRYKDNIQKRLLNQVIYMILGNVDTYKRTGGRHKLVGAYCTAAQKFEIEMNFEFFRNAMEKELETFYTAFCHKNRLFPTEEIAMEKTSEDEISNLDALKIGMMMEGMERHTIKKMIEG